MVSKIAKKDKIILICIGTLILIGIIGFLVSGGEQNSSNSNKKQELPGNPTDTKTKVKNPDIPKTQTYTLTRSYSGKEAYISFFSNYYCSVDFSSFSGEGYLGGDLYLSLEYPPAGGNCKYTQEDDIITVTYNGVVRKKVESGKAVLEDYFRNIMPTIQFKYDRDSKTVDMTPLNGRWEQFGASGGLDMVYFIENGSEEDLKEKKEQEQAQKEKAQQEQNAEEMSKEAIQNSLNQTTITLNDSSGNQTGDFHDVWLQRSAERFFPGILPMHADPSNWKECRLSVFPAD